ncbi:MAG: hypothetical protein DRR08_14685 [Candidatus Parabeggiatoa sp. nov. 2]|nr:MAG: hypothetical protein DRR08_14685 [Gammaproteobacteria bacterium]
MLLFKKRNNSNVFYQINAGYTDKPNTFGKTLKLVQGELGTNRDSQTRARRSLHSLCKASLEQIVWNEDKDIYK